MTEDLQETHGRGRRTLQLCRTDSMAKRLGKRCRYRTRMQTDTDEVGVFSTKLYRYTPCEHVLCRLACPVPVPTAQVVIADTPDSSGKITYQDTVSWCK